MNTTSVVFFDLDDTLVDHKGAERKALLAIKKKYFSTVEDAEFEKIWLEKTTHNWQLFTEKKLSFEEQRTNRIVEVWSAFKKNISTNLVKKIFLEYLSLYEQYWQVFSDVMPILQHLKGKNIHVGIITNGNLEQQLKKLSQVGILPFFKKELLIVSDEVGFSKPNAEIFLYAKEKAAVADKNIVFVGDNFATDIAPALKLKWNAVLLDRNKVGSSIESIDNLSKLIKII
jgi:putative hydrolase of the HAD superfamily